MTPFRRGQYNEIIPPPLYGGATPEQAVDALARAVEKKTGDTLHRPQRGKSRAGLEQLSALYLHQRQLLAALAGRATGPVEQAIRILVEDAGEPLSLRPAFLEELHHHSFAPVLQKDGGAWRIGIPERGRSQLITAPSCADAFVQAQRLYTSWVEEENKSWQDKMKEAARRATPDAATLSWEAALVQQGEAALPPPYRLERWGGHGHYALWLPGGQFFAFTAATPEQAALYMRVMADQKGLPVSQPTPGRLQSLLRALLPPVTQQEGGRYLAGELRAQLESHRITIRRGGQDEAAGYTQIRAGIAETFRQERGARAPRLIGQLALPDEWNPAERLGVAVLWSLYRRL